MDADERYRFADGAETRQPLGLRIQIAVGNGFVYLGNGGSPRVDVFNSTGVPVEPLLLPTQPHPITEEDKAAAIAADIEPVRPYLTEEDLRSRLHEWEIMEWPEAWPIYDALLVDSEGYIWVRAGVRRRGDSEWWVFSPGHVLLGTVQLPGDIVTFEIGEDYVLGRVSDERGAHRVVMYRLIKPE